MTNMSIEMEGLQFEMARLIKHKQLIEYGDGGF